LPRRLVVREQSAEIDGAEQQKGKNRQHQDEFDRRGTAARDEEPMH